MANLGKTLGSDKIRNTIAALLAEMPHEEDPQTREEMFSESELLQGVLDEVHWTANALFIREDYFYEGFAEECASGFGPTTGWPYDCIDWSRAAIELRQDYVAVDILGDTYLVRG